ncbi:hypothetical protein C8R45DRAFT_928940 [Mycena sanguinolenta]|nr:hypothetical protein C8R45DRAFT_928940 [Mycena sanguinolenta]
MAPVTPAPTPVRRPQINSGPPSSIRISPLASGAQCAIGTNAAVSRTTTTTIRRARQGSASVGAAATAATSSRPARRGRRTPRPALEDWEAMRNSPARTRVLSLAASLRRRAGGRAPRERDLTIAHYVSSSELADAPHAAAGPPRPTASFASSPTFRQTPRLRASLSLLGIWKMVTMVWSVPAQLSTRLAIRSLVFARCSCFFICLSTKRQLDSDQTDRVLHEIQQGKSASGW